MSCPICQRRKAKRFCPAKAQSICSICCGTEREVTIDCPTDCPYLVASRAYDSERQEIDWSKLPFADVKIHPSFARSHTALLTAITLAISRYARDSRSLVDTDVIEATRALAETYRTLSSGLYYEKPPEYPLQRGLYDALKAALKSFREKETATLGFASTRDLDIRDALIFFAQLGSTRANGRPRGRAYLDFLRDNVVSEEPSRPASRIVLP